MIISKYLTLILFSTLCLLPSPVSSMCEEPVPIKVKVKVTSCKNEYVKGFIQEFQGRVIKEEQELHWSSSVEKDCSKFKIGQVVEVNIMQACCDTPDTPCYFGDIVPESVNSPE